MHCDEMHAEPGRRRILVATTVDPLERCRVLRFAAQRDFECIDWDTDGQAGEPSTFEAELRQLVPVLMWSPPRAILWNAVVELGILTNHMYPLAEPAVPHSACHLCFVAGTYGRAS